MDVLKTLKQAVRSVLLVLMGLVGLLTGPLLVALLLVLVLAKSC